MHVTGSFKNFFEDGTTSAKVKMSGSFGSGAITVKGAATITDGTGAYKHMKRPGPVTCTTNDAGKTFLLHCEGTATP